MDMGMRYRLTSGEALIHTNVVTMRIQLLINAISHFAEQFIKCQQLDSGDFELAFCNFTKL